MEIAAIHHVSLTVSDLERSRAFYRDILSLPEIARPPFDFPGAWFQVGAAQQLHLIVHRRSTFRNKPLDTRDLHFAVRVASFQAALDFLHAKGFREDAAADDPWKMIVQPYATAGFPQIYILDPDGHIIEINAEKL
jgi:catechol 2,3-dioxygenase-like lactoylglutathione lyase family enzyme